MQEKNGEIASGIHMMLARMKTSYTQLYEDQMEEQMANGKFKCVDDLLNKSEIFSSN